MSAWATAGLVVAGALVAGVAIWIWLERRAEDRTYCELARRCRQWGWNDAIIARHLGRTEGQVRRWLRETPRG